MRRHRITRTLVATASALALAGGVAACSDSPSEKAAKEVGSRNGDGSMTLFAPDERGEPVSPSAITAATPMNGTSTVTTKMSL